MSSQKSWDVARAKKHYRVAEWGLDYFDINKQGNMVAKTADMQIDLFTLTKKLRSQDISLPVLVRFPQILQQSLENLCGAFTNAMQAHHYKGEYIAAYPIKVNQQAIVIKHFQMQTEWPVAFEVGSKAELMACLGIMNQSGTIICNGYKDEHYIRMALMGKLLGHDVVIVLENLSEFDHVLKLSELLNVTPKLGMRVRLSSIAKGNWQNTGGEHSKFGLTANEVLSLVEVMHTKNAMPWMKMLHFHMGSQISNLKDIQSGVGEGMHYYSQLCEQGIEFEMLNVGGGLAVDYEGSQNNNYFSMNYSAQEYADVVVQVVQQQCVKYDLNVPTIFSENGRAMTAHHAVLISNVVDAEYKIDEESTILSEINTRNKNIYSLYELANTIDLQAEDIVSNVNLSKQYQILKKILADIKQEFIQGEMSLLDKATAEKITYHIYQKIMNTSCDLHGKERIEIEDKLTAKYFCNFSLFKSTPDIWGLGQILPIMPLHRLDKRPKVRARIYDLTCDSDGRVDRYIEAESIQSHLSLHELEAEQEYVMGIFLVGAYQEILGDMHNLFGDTSALNIMMNADGSYQICDEEPGDTIAEILSYLHIDTHGMLQLWLQQLIQNNINEPIQSHVLDELTSYLETNSYLD